MPPTATLTNPEFKNDSEATLVYPNPSKDVFTIVSPEESEILVISPRGNILSKQKAVSGNTQINLASKVPGMYLIKVINENTIVVKKVILKWIRINFYLIF